MTEPRRWIRQTFGGRTYQRLNLDHPAVAERIMAAIGGEVPVYYDREWPMTRRFCRWLARHPERVEGRRVLVVGAGVGMEAVVAGALADRLWVNDLAPLALELQLEQLERNGVADPGVLPGSFGAIDLPDEADLVLACFVLYDDPSADAMRSLLARTEAAGVPVLVADRDIGGHFSAILDETSREVSALVAEDDGFGVVSFA